MRELDRIAGHPHLVRDRRRRPPRHRARRRPARRRPPRRRPARPWREPGRRRRGAAVRAGRRDRRRRRGRRRRGVPVGHCSGATGLDVLAGHEAFALHPLMTVPRERRAARSPARAPPSRARTPRALAVARRAGRAARACAPTTVADEDRAAYHAAASIASNFLVTLEGAAERLAATAGVDRALLAPLVRAAVENWARLGAARRAHRPDRARRRGHRRAPARRRRASARPTCCRCSTRWPTRRGRSPGAGAMRTLRTIAEVRAHVAAARARRPHASGSCRRWARSTTATRR